MKREISIVDKSVNEGYVIVEELIVWVMGFVLVVI